MPLSAASQYLEDNKGNMLAAMMARQNDLDEEFGGIENWVFKRVHGLDTIIAREFIPTQVARPMEAMASRARQMYCANITLRVIVELIEMLSHFDGWKLWKRNPRPADPVKAQEEFIDAWHFMLMLADYIGFDSESLYKAYFDKAEINAQRQQKEY